MAAVRTASGFVHPPERCCGLPWTFATRLPTLASGLALAVKPAGLAVVPMMFPCQGMLSVAHAFLDDLPAMVRALMRVGSPKDDSEKGPPPLPEHMAPPALSVSACYSPPQTAPSGKQRAR